MSDSAAQAISEPIDFSILKSLRLFGTHTEILTGEGYPGEDNTISNSFHWLCGVLDRLSMTNKCLEMLVIQVNYALEKETSELRHWEPFIRLVLDETRFPALRKVDIRVATFLQDDLDHVVGKVGPYISMMKEISNGRICASLSTSDRRLFLLCCKHPRTHR